LGKKPRLRFDEIGYWSEVKLDIVKKYAAAYSRILAAQESPRLYHVYVDAFAGAGVHISKVTGDFVLGSPLNALNIRPPFREFHYVDIDPSKVAYLQQLVGDRSDVHIHPGDCNSILLEEVFPQIKWEDYCRGLCLLDPYGLTLNWKVIQTAGKMGSIEIFLNFPVADMNRNVFWRNPEGVDPADIERMTCFWGDESWRKVAYTVERGLFGSLEQKTENWVIAQAFRDRLHKVAGFVHVPDPIPMRNTKNAIVYYLFFAAQKPVAEEIVEDIFNKHRTWGAQ